MAVKIALRKVWEGGMNPKASFLTSNNVATQRNSDVLVFVGIRDEAATTGQLTTPVALLAPMTRIARAVCDQHDNATDHYMVEIWHGVRTDNSSNGAFTWTCDAGDPGELCMYVKDMRNTSLRGTPRIVSANKSTADQAGGTTAQLDLGTMAPGEWATMAIMDSWTGDPACDHAIDAGSRDAAINGNRKFGTWETGYDAVPDGLVTWTDMSTYGWAAVGVIWPPPPTGIMMTAY